MSVRAVAEVNVRSAVPLTVQTKVRLTGLPSSSDLVAVAVNTSCGSGECSLSPTVATGAASTTVAVSVTAVPVRMPSLGVTETTTISPTSPAPSVLKLNVSVRAVAEVNVRSTVPLTVQTKVSVTGLFSASDLVAVAVNTSCGRAECSLRTTVATGGASTTVAVSVTVVPVRMPSLGVTETTTASPTSPAPNVPRLNVSVSDAEDVNVRSTVPLTVQTKVRLTGLPPASEVVAVAVNTSCGSGVCSLRTTVATGAASTTVAVSVAVVPLRMPSLGVTETTTVSPTSPAPSVLKLNVSVNAVAKVNVRSTVPLTVQTKVSVTGLYSASDLVAVAVNTSCGSGAVLAEDHCSHRHTRPPWPCR